MSQVELDLDTLFCKAIAIQDTSARLAFIAKAACGTEKLRQNLEKLVAAHFQAGEFLLEPVGVSEALEAVADQSAGSVLANQELGSEIGVYKIRELLGEGGMGRVYVAQQESPIRRKVALKLIKPGMDSQEVIGRFEAERQALTLMDHPNIAKVLDAGCTDRGRPYFVMELVKGVPITEHCDAHCLDIQERLGLFLQVCRAVQHAHQKAIIHRDLKPANILVAMHDTLPVVKVIDFGVAKALDSKLTDHTLYTGHHRLVGTPMYMSPEQAGQNSLDIDTRGDIYSLGLILYELLSGATPFESQIFKKVGYDEIRQLIREVDPPCPSVRFSTLNISNGSIVADNRKMEPRRLSRVLRGELDWIVMKALEKDRNRRYATSNSLARDIERYLQNDPIEAGPPSLSYRVWKLARRYRLSLLTLGCIFTTFIIAAIVSVREAAKAHRAEQLASARLVLEQEARRETQERESHLQIQLYASDVAVAWHAWVGGNRERALELLERHVPKPESPHTDLREFAWQYLALRCRQQPLKFEGHQSPLLTADISSDDRLISSAYRDGSVCIWDVPSADKVTEWNYSNKEVTCVAWSPDGGTLATCGQDTTVRLWSVETWEEVARLEGHESTVMCVAWSPDGCRLASSCRGGEVRIWKTESRSLEVCLNQNSDVVRCVAWSPDGTLLAAADGPSIRLWSTLDWSLSTENHSLSGGILSVAFSPDGKWLAIGGYQGTLVLCEPQTGRERTRLDGIAAIWSVAFTPDASHLILGSGEGGPQLFRMDYNHGQVEMVRTAFDYGGRQRAVIATNSGRHILTATEESSQLQLWDYDVQLGYQQTKFTDSCLGILPRRRLAITADSEGAILLCGLGGDTAVSQLTGHQRPVSAAVADALENTLATFTPDGELFIWDLVTGTERRRMRVPPDVIELHFDSTGSTLAVVSTSVGVQLWDVVHGNPLASAEPLAAARACAYSPDGQHLALACRQEATIYQWDFQNGQIATTLKSDQPFSRLCYSDDGGLLLAVGKSSDVTIWDVHSGREHARLLGHRGPVHEVALSLDGQTIATSGADRTVRLWHMPSGQQLLQLPQIRVPHWLTFDSPGSLIVCVEGESPNHRGLLTFDAGMVSR